ncbi:MAG: hypothetical protein QXQ50_04550 [Candidatus Bathyarchaeia archaeon]
MRLGDIITMVTLGIIIVAAIIIVANFQTAVLQMNLPNQQEGLANTTITNVYTGLQLAGIGIIILAAVGIIALILGAFGGGRK